MQSRHTEKSSAENLIYQTTPKLWRKTNSSNSFYHFGKRYFNDPVGFARDCILWTDGDHLTPYQEEIIGHLVTEPRVCARSCHGAGKTTMSAIVILWYALTRDALAYDWKIVTTASVNRQLSKYLWPEVHKWARKLNWNKIGRPELKEGEELFNMAINLRYGQGFAVASNKSDLIEGAHADHLLYIFDESKVIPDATWSSAEGAMVNDLARWFSISTPGAPHGKFYAIQTGEVGTQDWWTRHVKLEEVIAAGRISQKWVDDRKAEWGEESALFKNKVLGEFAYDDINGLIPLEWVEAAFHRYLKLPLEAQQPEIIDALGIDVARGGGDLSVIAKRTGNVCGPLDKHGDIDTMELAGLAAAYIRRHKCVAWVDIVGMGAGVYDRLNEQFDNLIFYFHPQEKSKYVDRTGLWEFQDTYSAAWWNFREMLDPANGENVCLAPDKDLKIDLTAAQWTPLSNGKIQVERKEKVKERIGRSPDAGDAVVMVYWDPLVVMGMDHA